MTGQVRVCLVVPVYGNAPTLRPLRDRVAAAVPGPWVLRLVVDACPHGSLAVARELSTEDPRVRVTALRDNVGQHAALVRGLRDEPDADVWVCLDADLQDPPEAVPLLVERLLRSPAAAVFAGRRGAYESAGRRLTGTLHRRVLSAVTGLPPDAGAFFAMDARMREQVVDTVTRRGAPSVVVAAGGSALPVESVPCARQPRPVGVSAWTARRRLRQSLSTLTWACRARRDSYGRGRARTT